MSLLPIISNHQYGSRNAKVYKDSLGNFGVLVYDSVDDYNGYESFAELESAKTFAEDWILRVT
jgi:hypothetical protein